MSAISWILRIIALALFIIAMWLWWHGDTGRTTLFVVVATFLLVVAGRPLDFLPPRGGAS